VRTVSLSRVVGQVDPKIEFSIKSSLSRFTRKSRCVKLVRQDLSIQQRASRQKPDSFMRKEQLNRVGNIRCISDSIRGLKFTDQVGNKLRNLCSRVGNSRRKSNSIGLVILDVSLILSEA
jgi:hypothetical protein